ncbi:hypothetical protein StrepF001_12710 [Streptomyces sp. F001]|nr:hypothetical protein StrepF001_12710 [Streptomyces sp. F001]
MLIEGFGGCLPAEGIWPRYDRTACCRFPTATNNTSNYEVLRRPLESTQFGSWAFTQRARASGLLPSMGSIGDCVDNAMMESFWARVQVELLNRRRWRTRLELSTALFEYLEIFHNRQRRHSALGMLSPVEYELRSPPVA